MEGQEYRCSFCGKRRDEVKHLIGGPDMAHGNRRPVYICDQCVNTCNRIIAEDEPMPAPLPR